MIHTAAGTLAQTEAHFNNPAAQVSAHYGVSFTGEIHQYVQLEDTAWANGILSPGNKWPFGQNTNPNLITVSIETEGHPNDPVTPQMYSATKWLCKFIQQAYPTIIYVVPHNIITATQCPGPRWTSGKLQQLASELELETVVR